MLRWLRPWWMACLCLLGSAFAAAQTFPDRPILLLCAFPAGAGADAALRALAQGASKRLGQPVVVENRPGVGGTLAAAGLMTVKHDGYTLAQVTNTLMRQPFIGKTPYDPARDFSYILGVTAFEFGLLVRADAPWQTLDSLVAHAKSQPGRVTYGTSGIGTAQHQVMEQIAEANGITWSHVPYKGTAPLMTDLQGGHLNAVSDTSAWGPFVESGKFRLLAVYNANRLKRWPGAPTLKELGYDIAESVPWGIVGPTGMDPKVMRTLHDAFQAAMTEPAFLSALSLLGQEPRYMSSDDYRKYMHGRIAIERGVVDKYNLRQP